jgi:hypothetical protein
VKRPTYGAPAGYSAVRSAEWPSPNSRIAERPTCGSASAGTGGRQGIDRVAGSAAASDPARARHLWTVSEELTGTTFPEPAVAARG